MVISPSRHKHDSFTIATKILQQDWSNTYPKGRNDCWRDALNHHLTLVQSMNINFSVFTHSNSHSRSYSAKGGGLAH